MSTGKRGFRDVQLAVPQSFCADVNLWKLLSGLRDLLPVDHNWNCLLLCQGLFGHKIRDVNVVQN